MGLQGIPGTDSTEVKEGKTIHGCTIKDKTMTQDTVFIKCAGCGTNNRIPKARLKYML